VRGFKITPIVKKFEKENKRGLGSIALHQGLLKTIHGSECSGGKLR